MTFLYLILQVTILGLFWLCRNVSHGKRRLQNISPAAEGTEGAQASGSFCCSPRVWGPCPGTERPSLLWVWGSRVLLSTGKDLRAPGPSQGQQAGGGCRECGAGINTWINPCRGSRATLEPAGILAPPIPCRNSPAPAVPLPLRPVPCPAPPPGHLPECHCPLPGQPHLQGTPKGVPELLSLPGASPALPQLCHRSLGTHRHRQGTFFQPL
uniref:Uncharacterized protein n=1 Tax=Serinus canaria TaxID=9135 RepID=A0A8C9MZ86_SERCA